MTGTTTTTRAGVTAHALHAIAQHIEARSLPTPRRITFLSRELVITTFGVDGERWATTLGDGTGIHCVDVTGGRASFETTGLLPDTGVRVRVRWTSRSTLAVAR